MSRKSFSTRAADEELEPVEFDIDGEVFQCMAILTAEALAEVGNPDGGSTHNFQRFLELMMVDDENRVRFRKRIRDKDRIVEPELVAEIANYVLKEVTNSTRPTRPPIKSRGGSASVRALSAESSG